MIEGASLRLRLEEARVLGVGAFDGLRLRFVERLIELSESGGEGKARLEQRADDRLQALLADFEQAKVRAESLLDRLDETAHDDFQRGDFRAVERAARRSRPKQRADETHKERLTVQVAARSTAPPPAGGGDMLELAERLYHERCGDALTRRAVSQLRHALPDEAGPYHGTTVAAAGLESLGEYAPQLLRAWLQKLRNLDAFREIPDAVAGRADPSA